MSQLECVLLFCLKHAGHILFVLLRNVCNVPITYVYIYYVIHITVSGFKHIAIVIYFNQNLVL